MNIQHYIVEKGYVKYDRYAFNSDEMARKLKLHLLFNHPKKIRETKYY